MTSKPPRVAMAVAENRERVIRPSFSVHPTRRIVDDEPIAAAITPDRFAGARFASPPARALREDERLYVSGAFTLAELERIVAWARGGGR